EPRPLHLRRLRRERPPAHGLRPRPPRTRGPRPLHRRPRGLRVRPRPHRGRLSGVVGGRETEVDGGERPSGLASPLLLWFVGHRARAGVVLAPPEPPYRGRDNGTGLRGSRPDRAGDVDDRPSDLLTTLHDRAGYARRGARYRPGGGFDERLGDPRGARGYRAGQQPSSLRLGALPHGAPLRPNRGAAVLDGDHADAQGQERVDGALEQGVGYEPGR